jgi:hypothetical protein
MVALQELEKNNPLLVALGGDGRLRSWHRLLPFGILQNLYKKDGKIKSILDIDFFIEMRRENQLLNQSLYS